jgi:hypothetical protein
VKNVNRHAAAGALWSTACVMFSARAANGEPCRKTAAEEYAIQLFRPVEWDGTLGCIHQELFVK